jgi:serine/threonine protein kinase
MLVADPTDTGGGKPRTEQYTGPTNQVRPKSEPESTHDGGPPKSNPIGTARAMSAVEINDDDDSATTVNTPTPLPGRRPTAIASSPRFMLQLSEGSPVGDYEIQSQIGEGAMGTVYSAVHPLIGKSVAIKVLKPELCSNQASVDRFVQEAQAVNRIGHPNIVDVYHLGELPDGRAYFVMEWLRGQDLKARLKTGPIELSEACEILSGITRALEAAHAKEIIHRDLKPDNVFLHQIDNSLVTVKLLDFGIAKLMRDKLTTEKTQTGNMLGTPQYISPEQARGIDVTYRSDIYSLGVMAYELLAGRPPFTGETGMDLVVKHLNEEPPQLSQFARVPKPLEQCVMAMLAKDPAQRPTLAAVRRVLDQPTRKLSIHDMPWRASQRRRWPIALGFVAALAVAGIVVWQLSSPGDEEPSQIAAAPQLPALPLPEAKPTPAPAPPPHDNAETLKPVERGTIAITVRGGDASIMVDGEEAGKGRVIKMVDAGEHQVVVVLKGKDPIKRTATVKPDEVTELTVTVPGAPVVIRPPIRRPPPVKKPPTKPPPDLLVPKGMKK